MLEVNHNVYKYIDILEKSIDSYHKFLRFSSEDDLLKNWEKSKHALIKLQQLLAVETERVRSTDNRSTQERELHNSQDGWRDLRFQDCKLLDFSIRGVPDCSDYRFADFSGANLSGTSRANRTRFNYAKLIGADLSDIYWHADLTGADLSGANLQGARLSCELSSTNLSDADLCDADLSFAHCLVSTNFSNANVTNTKFGRGWGIYPSLKQDIISRGAIFDES
jgi:uncharacterized protein YjbI with pentapeptide repeats